MGYTKKTWVDEILAGAERFEILDNAGNAVNDVTDLAACQIKLKTAVTTPGTAVNASNMNNIEDGIEAISEGAAMSVKGVAGNSPGDVADIAAADDGAVLRRSGNAVGFGEVNTDGIADSAVTPAKTNFFEGVGIYFGKVAQGGAGTKLPSGWSSSKTATGKYKVTHNFDSTNYVVTLGADNKYPSYFTIHKDYFEVHLTGYDNSTHTMKFYDAAWNFIVMKY